MPTIHERVKGGCQLCRQITDPMWVSTGTAFLYCNDCRRLVPRQLLARVV